MTARQVRVKICGLRDVETMLAAVRAGADAVGFVLAPGSPREVDLDTAARLVEATPPMITPVLVLRDADPTGPDAATIERLAARARLQLHGDEDEHAIAAWRSLALTPVIRGFAFDPIELRRWDRNPNVGALLVDGPAAGSGAAFDHAALARAQRDLAHPVILAGGLDPENVRRAIDVARPFAVDVSSGVESAPGVKSVERIEAFCRAVFD